MLQRQSEDDLSLANSSVVLVTDDGDRLSVRRSALGSCPLLAALDGDWREAHDSELRLERWSSQSVRAMCACISADDASAAVASLDADIVVEVARLAHYLELQWLLSSTLRVISSAVDEENAASILMLAEELGARELHGLALACMVTRLSSIQRSEFWMWLPADARAKVLDLHKLCGDTSYAMAFCRNTAALVHDANEALALLRDTAAEQQERLESARARQIEAEEAGCASATHGAQRLQAQEVRVRGLQLHVAEQQLALAELRRAGSALAGSAAPASPTERQPVASERKRKRASNDDPDSQPQQQQELQQQQQQQQQQRQR